MFLPFSQFYPMPLGFVSLDSTKYILKRKKTEVAAAAACRGS